MSCTGEFSKKTCCDVLNLNCDQGRKCPLRRQVNSDCELNQTNSDGSNSGAPFDWVTDYFYAGFQFCGVILASFAIACMVFWLVHVVFI